MKVGVLTYHFADNYGAVLQTKATKVFLERLGHEVEIINYASDRMINSYEINPLKMSKKRIVENTIDYLKRVKQYKLFERFRKEQLGVRNSDRINDPKDLSNNYDVVVSGSDQVWNLNLSGNDETYFLNYLSKSVLKVGYAISMGKKDDSSEFKSILRRNVDGFHALSFREVSAAECVREIVGKMYVNVVDPVFLLNKNDWSELSSKPESVEESSQFVLLYQLENNKELVEKALNLAKEKNLEVMIIHPTCTEYIKEGKFLRDVGPREFIWLIEHAQYVCTNSFHGMAFSIIFLKKLVAIAHKTLGDRNKQLFSLLNIKNVDRYIDFSSVDMKRLNEEIIYSKKWLKEACEYREV